MKKRTVSRMLAMMLSSVMIVAQMSAQINVMAAEEDVIDEVYEEIEYEDYEDQDDYEEVEEDYCKVETDDTETFEEDDLELVTSEDEDTFDNSYFKDCDSMSLEQVKSFYYDQLNDMEKSFYRDMEKFTIDDHVFKVSKEDVSEYSSEQIRFSMGKAYTALLTDQPSYHMYLERYGQFEETEDKYVFSVPRNIVTEDAYRRSLAKVAQLKETFAGDKDRYIKLVQLWDYMGRNTDYDPYYPFTSSKKLTYNDCAAGIFYNNTAVCAGYADAIKIICDEIGIPCIVVGNKGHAWNFVEMEDGKWYSVDFTRCCVDDEREINNYSDQLLLGRNSSSITGTMTGGEYLYLMSKLYHSSVDYNYYFPKIQNEQYSYGETNIDYSYELADFVYEEQDLSFIYSVNDDKTTCTITSFSGEQKGDLIIPSQIDGYEVTGIGAEAFILAKGFDGKLVLPDTLKFIDDYAFQNCTGLSGELKLPENLEKIGPYAFQGDVGFTGDLVIPESVKEINHYAFYMCEGFDGDLKLPSNLEILEGAFPYTGFKGTLYFPDNLDWDSELVSGAHFSSFHINETNRKYVTRDGILYNKDMTVLLACPGGKEGEIIFPNTLTEIGDYAFYRCDLLKGDIQLPEGVTRVGDYSFDQSGFDGAIILPDSLQEIGISAFLGTSITGDLKLPKDLKIIKQYAFCACDLLDGEIILNDQLQTIETYAFVGSRIHGKIIFPDSIKYIGDHAFQHIGTISSYSVPSGIEYLGDNALESSFVMALYYYGEKADWDELVQGRQNVIAPETKVHFGDDIKPVEINIINPPNAVKFEVGFTSYTLEGLEVEVKFSDDTVSNLNIYINTPWAGGIKAEFPNISTAGEYEVTIRYENVEAKYKITVIDPKSETVAVDSVTLNTAELKLVAGESDTLEATISPKDATNTNVSWSSDNESVATVDENGKVTAVAAGEATITVKTEDGEHTADCNVTVSEEAESFVIIIDPKDLKLSEGETAALSVTTEPESATELKFTYKSSDEDVATVDQDGKVTAVAEGTATITVATEDGTVTADCKVTVEAKAATVTGVSLNATKLEMVAGKTAELTATVEPEDAPDKTVTWSSDKPAVATVDENGKVTAVAAGTTKITATTVDGEKTATCVVTVTKKTEISQNTFSLDQASEGVPVINNSDYTLKVDLNAKGGITSASIVGSNGKVAEEVDSYLANVVTEYEEDGKTPKTFYTLVFSDGKWDTTYDSGQKGAYQYMGVEYFVAGGVVNQNANGLIYTGAAGWRFLAAGHVVTDNEGLVMYNDEWFWIDKNGKCDDTYAAIVKWNGADFLVHGGRLRTDYSGFTYDPQDTSKWYHINNGQVWGDGEITDISIEGGEITRNCVNGVVQ